MNSKTDAIQLMIFLCSDGALVPERESDKVKIKSSKFESKIFRRCENLLFGVTGTVTDGSNELDGVEPSLTKYGYAACLFYFLSFRKPELSRTILEISKKTDLHSCKTVNHNWPPIESRHLRLALSSSDIEMITFIKTNLDEMHENSDWMQSRIKEITRLFNEIHSPAGSDDSKLESIDKLYGSVESDDDDNSRLKRINDEALKIWTDYIFQ